MILFFQVCIVWPTQPLLTGGVSLHPRSVVAVQDSNESIVLAKGGINRVTLLEKIKGLHADVDGSALDWWRKNLPKLIQLGAASRLKSL
jgi:hypothetical protein